MSKDRDGFVVRDMEGKEIDFIPCAKDGSMRDRVERGLLINMDRDRFYVVDTREELETA